MKRTALSFLTILLLMLAGLMTVVYAGEEDRVPDIDTDRDCSLTVLMNKSGEAISGAGIEIIQIASVTTSGGGAKYELLNDYAASGVELEGISVKGSEVAAAKLSKLADRKGISGERKVTDAAGKARFDKLLPGMYLVRQISQSGIADKYKIIKPFLAMVPEIKRNSAGNEWNYDVTAAPKPGVVSDPGIIDRDPPIEKVVKGNPVTDGTFNFRLRAADVTNPMPEGSRRGEKTMTIKGAGTDDFGVWHYTEAGTYIYYISEINTGEAGYSYDTVIYTVTDKVTYKGGSLVLETSIKDNLGNKDIKSIVFTNEFSYARIVDTGDGSSLFALIAIILASATAICIIKRRRNEEK